VSLWQKLRSAFIRDDEPSFAKDDDDPAVSLSPYPTADVLGERAAAHEDVEPQREDEGTR
jgi:hypothetical protein